MTESKSKKIKLTQDSYDSLQAEWHDLEKVKLPNVIERIAKAREQGDLSENSEYKDAKDQQELLEVRISEIKDILAQAVIIAETTDATQIGVGSQVTVRNEKKEKLTYTIVGEFDKMAMEDNTISAVSPIGKALMGKKINDQVKVETPVGVKVLQVVGIK